MVIAINTKYFLPAGQLDFSGFIYENFSHLASRLPGHTFIFIFAGPVNASFRPAENSIPVIAGPANNAGIFQGLSYNLKIASLLRKYKADVFINADARCSWITKMPQCFILYSPAILSNNTFAKDHHLAIYKKYIPSCLKKARAVFTDSEFSKEYISTHYKNADTKIRVTGYADNDQWKPVEWEERENMKKRYAGGSEYFVFYADAPESEFLFTLLKAFSQFKKWQKSGMKLIIVQLYPLPKDFIKSLTLYKYRTDVAVLDDLPQAQLANVVAAAYAMLYFCLYEGFFSKAFGAIQAGVPVITLKKSALAETGSTALLYTNFNEPREIAEKLIAIFKDEKMRQELIEKAREQLRDYYAAKKLNVLWNTVLEATGKTT